MVGSAYRFILAFGLTLSLVACFHGGSGSSHTPNQGDNVKAFGQVIVTPDSGTIAPIELSTIEVTFEFPIVNAELPEPLFTLVESEDPTQEIEGEVTISENVLTFSIQQKMTPRTLYLATISSGIRLEDETELGSDYSWTFMTDDPEQGIVLGTPQIVNSIPDYAETPQAAWDPHRESFHIVWKQKMVDDVSLKASVNTATLNPFFVDPENSTQIGPADQHVFNMGPVVVSPASDQTVHSIWTQYSGSLWGTQETGTWEPAMEFDPSPLCDSPNLAIDPSSGIVYATWVQDQSGLTPASLWASYRLPGSGLDSWATPQKVGDITPSVEPFYTQPRFYPAMAVSRFDGVLHVAWEHSGRVYYRKLNLGGAAWGDAWESEVAIEFPLESGAPGPPRIVIDERDPSQYTIYAGFSQRTYLGQFGGDDWGHVYFVNRRNPGGTWEGAIPLFLPKNLEFGVSGNGPGPEFSSLAIASDGTLYAAFTLPVLSGYRTTHLTRYRAGNPWTQEGWDASFPIAQTSGSAHSEPHIVIRPEDRVLVLWLASGRVMASQYDPTNVWSSKSWSDSMVLDALPGFENASSSALDMAKDPVSGFVLAVFCKYIGEVKQVVCTPIF